MIYGALGSYGASPMGSIGTYVHAVWYLLDSYGFMGLRCGTYGVIYGACGMIYGDLKCSRGCGPIAMG